MTDFQDLDILSLINDRPGWEISMEDDEGLNITDEPSQESQIPNCFANDGSMKSQSYSNFALTNFTSNEQQDNGDVTDEYGDNSDESDNDDSASDDDVKEESNVSDQVKNEISFSSDEEEAVDFDVEKIVGINSDEEADYFGDGENIDGNKSDEDSKEFGDVVNSDEDAKDFGEVANVYEVNSDEEAEDSGDAKSVDFDDEEKGDDGDDEEDDENSIVSEESVHTIQDQHIEQGDLSDVSDNEFDILESENEEVNEGNDKNGPKESELSDVSDNEFDILESENEEVKEEGDKEKRNEEKENGGMYDAEDVIVLQLSDVSDDESENEPLSGGEEDNMGLADQNDASCHGDDSSINTSDHTNFSNKENDNEIVETEDKLSDVSIDDKASEQESVDDDDEVKGEDDQMSIVEDQDDADDADWSGADESINDCTNDTEIVKLQNDKIDSKDSDDESELFDIECTNESDGQSEIATMEVAESPFGFVIGDVVGVSQEEFDRQDSSNVSVEREHIHEEEESIETEEKSQGNQGDGIQDNTPMDEQTTASMDVEMTLPSVYPRVESYQSDDYLYGNIEIKQEPMDDDDYIQEHDYLGQTNTLDIDNQSFPEPGTEELELDAGELLTYQDMFDITDTGRYKCKYCSARLGTFKALKIHIDRYHQKSYKCQQCDEVFSRSQDLAGHCKTHRREERISKGVKYDKDGKMISYPPVYRPRYSKSKNTVVEVNGKRMYKCRFCKKKFDMTQKLANHMQWKHKKERQHEQTIRTNLDGKHTVTKVSLFGAKMTIKMDSLDKDVPQRNLDEDVPQRNLDKDIPQRKQPIYSDTYQCTQCPEIFNKQQAMAVHVRNVHAKQLKIEKEKYKMKSRLALKKQKMKKNSKQKCRPRTVSEDGKMKEENNVSDVSSYLDETVTPPKQAKLGMECPLLKCKLCSKTFQESRSLKSHLNGMHAQYCCRYCPKAFYKVEKFMCHSFQHIGDLRYYVDANGDAMIKCRKCKGDFPAKGEFTLKHVTSHIKGKNPSGIALSLEKQVFLECSECGQPFISREFLFKHEMKHAASAGKKSDLKSSVRVETNSSAHSQISTNETICGPNKSPADINKPTTRNTPISSNSTTETTRPELVDQSFTDQTKIIISGESKTDSKKTFRSQVLQTEMISVNKIPFKCGMCEARFPNSQYLLHHMTLHMNGQYVFKIEVDRKKDELLKENESSEIRLEDVSSSKPKETSVSQPSNGNQMASTIVQQLSKGSNMASIISSNISPESDDFLKSNGHGNDHTYTSKVKRPSTDSSAQTVLINSSTNTTVISPSIVTQPITKKVLILPTKTLVKTAQPKPPTVVWPQIPSITPSPVRIAPTSTTVTPDITKKLHEMLSKKDQTVTTSKKQQDILPKKEHAVTTTRKLPNILPKRKHTVPHMVITSNISTSNVVKLLPTLGSKSANTRVLPQAKVPSLSIEVEKKIRELLDVHKPPAEKVTPGSVGVQTKYTSYTSLINPQKVTIQKSTASTSNVTSSSLQSVSTQCAITIPSETAQNNSTVSSSDTLEGRRPESPVIPTTVTESAQYSDTETLSAVSETPETGSPRSISPFVGLSSESDSDDLSEDEQALFEKTTMSVSITMSSETSGAENTPAATGVKKETDLHSPTGHSKGIIKNYKNQLDFAHGNWFECELCLYLCKTFKEFKNHLSTHKKAKKTKLVKCSVCPRKFISKWHLSKHMEIHRANAYSCSKCGANFRTSVAVMEHMEKKCAS